MLDALVQGLFLVLQWKGPKAKKGRGPLAFVGKGVRGVSIS